ncbi:GGDEF domain-containing protein [Croceicoccus bisphenolivorans]|uniref:GGDEF domain-containing protein n=1 Tax=Croceicoccus bisphenolivorans TaxID=1783232 RepID=UPI00082C8416|nr:GGDEF domain-containing protein [Croceicoccus bisphenolivorans]
MRFYNATRFLFPHSYSLRVFAVCFASVHVPIIGFGLVEVALGEWQWSIFLPLLFATVLGTGVGIAGLHGLMAPLRLATRDLERLERGQLVQDVPEGGPDLAGKLLHAVARAARETVSRMDELRTEAGTDMLTGLLNRRGFEETVAAVLRGGGGGTVAILDGDRFKAVNDELGHAEGDRVLCGLAQRMVGNMRAGDVAGRWGGDEFVMFFPGLGETAANEIVRRIFDNVLRDPDARVGGEPVTFSWGVASMERRRGDTLETAMKLADERLYELKETRRAA